MHGWKFAHHNYFDRGYTYMWQCRAKFIRAWNWLASYSLADHHTFPGYRFPSIMNGNIIRDCDRVKVITTHDYSIDRILIIFMVFRKPSYEITAAWSSSADSFGCMHAGNMPQVPLLAKPQASQVERTAS